MSEAEVRDPEGIGCLFKPVPVEVEEAEDAPAHPGRRADAVRARMEWRVWRRENEVGCEQGGFHVAGCRFGSERGRGVSGVFSVMV